MTGRAKGENIPGSRVDKKGRPKALDQSSAPHRVSVAIEGLDPLMRLGLTTLLRDDAMIAVADGDPGFFERPAARGPSRVLIAGESVDPSRLRHVRTLEGEIGVLVLAYDPSPAYGLLLLSMGATCVACSLPTAELLAAVHLTARGERAFVSTSGQRVTRRYPDDAPSLTPRELQVLRHLSQGASHAAVALALTISVRTVHTYAAAIRRKLAVRNKRELIGMPVPNVPSSTSGQYEPTTQPTHPP